MKGLEFMQDYTWKLDYRPVMVSVHRANVVEDDSRKLELVAFILCCRLCKIWTGGRSWTYSSYSRASYRSLVTEQQQDSWWSKNNNYLESNNAMKTKFVLSFFMEYIVEAENYFANSESQIISIILGIVLYFRIFKCWKCRLFANLWNIILS